jgi:hypothetical protein
LPPFAVDDSAAIAEGTPVSLSVIANDGDSDGSIDPRTVALTDPPLHASVLIDPVTGAILLTPELGFVGADAFSYTVRDNEGIVSNQARVMLAIQERAFAWQNPRLALDVNADGFVTNLDALLIINELNLPRHSDPASGAITSRPAPPDRPPAYLDVNGDNFIVPADAIRVINHLNGLVSQAQARSSAEDLPLAQAASALAVHAAGGEGEPVDSPRDDIALAQLVAESAVALPAPLVLPGGASAVDTIWAADYDDDCGVEIDERVLSAALEGMADSRRAQ